MDGFGDSFVPNGVAEDPAAEFLAREQTELAGIEDPPAVVEPAAEAPAAPPAEEQVAPPAPQDWSEDAAPGQHCLFEGSAPEVVVPPVAPAVERVVTPVPRVEPEAILRWREEHQRRLVEKDSQEEEAKEALRQKARQELEEWYAQHDESLGRTRHANRCAEKELAADAEAAEPGAEWERIAKLCDFNPKTARGSRDVSRMRGIILHVKQSPPVKA